MKNKTWVVDVAYKVGSIDVKDAEFHINAESETAARAKAENYGRTQGIKNLKIKSVNGALKEENDLQEVSAELIKRALKKSIDKSNKVTSPSDRVKAAHHVKSLAGALILKKAVKEDTELSESDTIHPKHNDPRWELYADDPETKYTCHHIKQSYAAANEARFKHTLNGKVIISHSKYIPDEWRGKA